MRNAVSALGVSLGARDCWQPWTALGKIRAEDHGRRRWTTRP